MQDLKLCVRNAGCVEGVVETVEWTFCTDRTLPRNTRGGVCKGNGRTRKGMFGRIKREKEVNTKVWCVEDWLPISLRSPWNCSVQ